MSQTRAGACVASFLIGEAIERRSLDPTFDRRRRDANLTGNTTHRSAGPNTGDGFRNHFWVMLAEASACLLLFLKPVFSALDQNGTSSSLTGGGAESKFVCVSMRQASRLLKKRVLPSRVFTSRPLRLK